MRAFLSLLGAMFAAGAGLFVVQSFGFRPELTLAALAWGGAVFGFLNFMMLEGFNGFADKFSMGAFFKTVLGMGVVFGALQLLTFYSNQAPMVASQSSHVLSTACFMAAIAAFAGVGHYLGGLLSGAKDD